MKSNFKITAFCFLAAGLAWQGCKTSVPPSSALTLGAKDLYTLLEIGPSSVTFNPNLYVEPGQTLGTFVEESSYPTEIGYINTPFTLNGSTCSSPGCLISPTSFYGQKPIPIVPTGIPDYPYAVNINGYMNDPEQLWENPGPGNFDSISFLAGPAYNGSFVTPGGVTYKNSYDLTPFQGLQFYVNVSSKDTAVDRLFQAYTLQILPDNGAGVAGGLCNDSVNPGPPTSDPNLTHCFDAFEYDFTDIARDQWVFVQKRWGDLKQFGNGSPPVPPTFSGVNLQQFVYFLWVESNAAQAVSQTVNFSITGIKFF